MKNFKNLSVALAGATACLSGVANVSAAETLDKNDFGNWDIKSAILFYNESDRVQAIEPVITATKQIDTDEFLSFKLVVDSLTGASASGAVPSTEAQTFSTPSGNDSYTTPANETPLDPTFFDTRYALSASWVKPISRFTKLTLGSNFSNEFDYLSLSSSALLAHDINNRNTTLSIGVSAAFDTIDTVGGIPVAFGRQLPEGQEQPRQGEEDDKAVIDVVLGVTQVLSKDSLLVFNYSFSQADGYLTDPYKVISVVDAASAKPIETLYENRPDNRTKHAVYTQYKRNFSGNILDASYRYSTDDFGIDSNTVDLRFKYRLNEQSFLKPHIRFYSQSEADFYTPFFVDGSQPLANNSSSFATADYRLGEFTSTTIGLEYGRDNVRRPWSVALEYYVQSGDEPDNTFGQLANQELYPDVDAVMLRINFDY